MTQTADELAILRTKTQMVFSGLETDLADLLRRKGEDVSETIADLLKSRNKKLDNKTADELIFEVYYQDLWDLAINLEEDKGSREKLIDLTKLASSENVKRARNAFAHANRPFLKHYWYCVAALASSPDIESLAFKETQAWLARAESGDLSSTKDLDSLSNYLRHIPNNLPEPEHSDTGYFGRTKDRDELAKTITTSRFNQICVCGPGGVGKTALTTYVIKDIALKNDFDFIFFYSFKSEFLTDAGVTTQAKDVSLKHFADELKEFLNSEYQEVSENIKGLIFLDNLEDLLVIDDSDFSQALEELPPHWKIVGTSRLSPNGFKILSIEPLDEKSLITLGTRYAALKGDSDIVKAFEQQKRLLVKACAQNPLAVKLAIDLSRRGLSLGEAAPQASEMVTNFSFKNLRALLDQDTLLVLEYLRQKGAANLFSISSDLEFEMDVCIGILEKIKNTSLVRMLPNDGFDPLFENTQLTSNFLISGEDISTIKQQVAQVIGRTQQKASLVNNLNAKYFRQHMSIMRAPETVPERAIQTLSKLFQVKRFSFALDRKRLALSDVPDNMRDLLSEWESMPSAFKKQAYFYLIRGRIFEFLSDQRAESDYQRYAKSIGSESETGVYAGYEFANLASFYQRQGDLLAAADEYLNAYNTDKNNYGFATSHCVCLQYTNDPEKVDQAISFVRPLARNDPRLTQTFVEAVKRRLETSTVSMQLSDIELALKLYIENAASWANKPILEDLISQLLNATDNNNYREAGIVIDPLLIFDAVQACLDNGGQLRRVASSRNMPLEVYLNEYFQKIGLECDENLIREKITNYSDVAVSDDPTIRRLVESGEFLTVKVRAVKDRFCFGVDRNDEHFFIHFSSVVEEFDGASEVIQKESVLAIKPKNEPMKEYRTSSSTYIVPEEWYVF